MSFPAHESGPMFLSPRLCELVNSLRKNGQGQLNDFWREIEERGTPLIEAHPVNPSKALVTFLARGSLTTDNFLIIGPLNNWKVRDGVLERIPDSDVWFRTYELPNSMRSHYFVAENDSLEDIGATTDWTKRSKYWLADRFNSNRLNFYAIPQDPASIDSSVSIMELPDAPQQPWNAARREVPKGRVIEEEFHSEMLNNDRRIWTYIPADIPVPPGGFPLLIVFDGDVYEPTLKMSVVLDNLIYEKKIKPLVALFICSLDQNTRNRELPCNETFLDSLIDEFIPQVSRNVAITSDPKQTCVAGSSYGGLVSVFAGYRRPDRFGLILAQAPAMFWKEPQSGERNWLINQFESNERVAIKIFMDSGSLDIYQPDTESLNSVESTRLFDRVIRSKGYESRYDEYCGGHDYACWRGSIVDGLIYLFGK